MDNFKNPDYYLKKVVADLQFCIDNMMDVEIEEFCNDDLLSSAICFKFIFP